MRSRFGVIPVALIVCLAGVGVAHAATITLKTAVTVTSVTDRATGMTTTFNTPILFDLSIAFDDGVTSLSSVVGPPSWREDAFFGEPTGLDGIPLALPAPPDGWISSFKGSSTIDEREFRSDSTPYFQLAAGVSQTQSYGYPGSSLYASYFQQISLYNAIRDAGYTSPNLGVPTIDEFLSLITQGGTFTMFNTLRARTGAQSGLIYRGTFEATTVPEPSGALLLAVGLGFWVKRRMRSDT